ncbi:OmpA family protein [Defluviimonas sp. WL0050]|uniref:OmpA family protein n=2 Tax=Albidovulum litorale TaxID=2984134 RepID=A0ABT2ZII7_9RHOB|nr:OmpA family protein [Defluviimonas sp. WL0050]
MVAPVVVSELPPPAVQPVFTSDADEDALRAALERQAALDRRFSLAQVRDIAEVRALVPVIDLDAITFETGSAAIRPDQAKSLARLGRLIQSYVADDPREVFLIEGHTDAVGSAAYNLALSDRRAESVALALTEYFAVPPENMVVQGYGEQFLKIETQDAERANRRASVRRITDLLRQAAN